MKKGIVIAATVLLVIVALEVSLRQVERRLSGNINHIYQIREIAEEIRQESGVPRVLFLGNSLINEAVDTALLEKELGRPVKVYKITPDGTTVWDWYFILNNEFFARGIYPDYLVVGFAWGLLSDQAERDPAELAAHFTRLADLPKLVGFGLGGIGEVSEYLLGTASRLFVYREMIRNRLLSSWIPNYETFVQQANFQENLESRPAADSFTADDFDLLHALIEQVDGAPMELMFVAMPVQNEYQLPAYLSSTLFDERNFVDYRDLFSGNTTVYKDAIHLNGDGQRLFSREMAAILKPLLSGGK
ncbi:hypothetical protein KQH41_00190 [bacterium]|nr:hypothetical protein [bacterium]